MKVQTVPTDIQAGLSGTLQYGKTSKQLLIICHGYQSSSEHPALVAIADGMVAAGKAVFTFNFSGSDSLDVAKQVLDIEAIISHFANDYAEIILIGGSFGALSSAIAAHSSKVAGLVTLNGFFGTGQLGKEFRSSFRLFKILALVSPRHRKIWHYLKRLLQPETITVPVLVIHSPSDEMVSIRQSRDFYNKLRSSKKFVELDDPDHNLSSPSAIDTIVRSVVSWLAR
jgi:alpha-beta hydrolase superfamily lysophospholipase